MERMSPHFDEGVAVQPSARGKRAIGRARWVPRRSVIQIFRKTAPQAAIAAARFISSARSAQQGRVERSLHVDQPANKRGIVGHQVLGTYRGARLRLRGHAVQQHQYSGHGNVVHFLPAYQERLLARGASERSALFLLQTVGAPDQLPPAPLKTAPSFGIGGVCGTTVFLLLLELPPIAFYPRSFPPLSKVKPRFPQLLHSNSRRLYSVVPVSSAKFCWRFCPLQTETGS